MKNDWTISYKQIGILVFAFSLGIILSLLFSNTQTESSSTFTTTELIGFVLSVILSGSSIVLAITAISLGKMSEQSVINRSDESIRLQNEVFIKTTEALQRIEASTGVTEKRLEDIIQGRVGDISHQVAEIASRHGRQSPKAVKELEETIRKSLLSSISEEGSSDKRREKRLLEIKAEEAEKMYQESHNNILLGVGNIDNVKVEKIGHGTIGVDDGDSFDGLFEIGGQTFSISTFRPEIDDGLLKSYLPIMAKELDQRKLKKSFMVFFTQENSPIDLETLSDSLGIIKDEIANKIEFINAPYNEINKVVDQIREKL